MTLTDYITQHQVDAIHWKADKLLGNLDSPILKGDRVMELAQTLALLPSKVARETYAKEIGKKYDVSWPTFKKVIEDALVIGKKKEHSKATVRKNEVRKLAGEPNKFRFFEETTKMITDSLGEKQEVFKSILVDEEKYFELLSAFGFTRYEQELTDKDREGENFQFVKLEENIIRSVSRQKIIDHILAFIKTDYDFDAAGYQHTDSNKLHNHFIRNMNKLFNKDVFARVVNDKPIIINRDQKDKSFFYYKNGFMEVDKHGYNFRNYDSMDGSVWATQMKDFALPGVLKFSLDGQVDILKDLGVFADFMYRVAGQNEKRFASLMSITGYVCHDYYQYKLKAINITDSTVSESSEGRTGKTLWAKMLGYVKALCEINGKDFVASNQRKYEKADLGTQIVHLNDLKTRGKDKFDFEDVFNDITEGYEVRKLYESPFRHQSKFIFSSNKTLNIVGSSQRDRILEYEWSSFFGEDKSPEQHYGHWFGRDWDETEWTKFHNFMALCAQRFHIAGLEVPEAINLGERKLVNHTAQEFLDFMMDIQDHLHDHGVPWDGYSFAAFQSKKASCTIHEFEFNKTELATKFKQLNKDFEWLTVRKFGDWLLQYSSLRLGIKAPKQWRSGGVGYIQFVKENNEKGPLINDMDE